CRYCEERERMLLSVSCSTTRIVVGSGRRGHATWYRRPLRQCGLLDTVVLLFRAHPVSGLPGYKPLMSQTGPLAVQPGPVVTLLSNPALRPPKLKLMSVTISTRLTPRSRIPGRERWDVPCLLRNAAWAAAVQSV